MVDREGPSYLKALLKGLKEGELELLDLTHPLSESTQHWPGGVPFSKRLLVDYDRGYRKFMFQMAEDVGTHVDSPAHFFEGMATIDRLPLRDLIGPGVVVDVREKVARDPDYLLSIEDLKAWEGRFGAMPEGAIVAMLSGWGSRWGNTESYRNMDERGVMHFPGYSRESAEFLVSEREVAGIGIDTLSLDFGGSSDFPVHRIMFEAGKFQMENMANLELLPASGALIFAIPLLVEAAPEAVARIFALTAR